jgi:hypothetical protein
VRAAQTVEDVARLVHRDLAQSLKYARMQGKSAFEGQHVGRENHLADGDIVELHPWIHRLEKNPEARAAFFCFLQSWQSCCEKIRKPAAQ